MHYADRTMQGSARQQSAFLLAALAMLAGLLHSMGRSTYCGCGSWQPFSWQTQSSHNSQHLLDAYSFSHLLHGLIFFWCLYLLRDRLSGPARWTAALGLEALWELLENSPLIIDRYRAVTISLDYYGDSIVNSCGDVLCCMLGYRVAARCRLRTAIFIFIAVEIGLLLAIRDNFTLNVLMLLYPLQSLRDWQAAR